MKDLQSKLNFNKNSVEVELISVEAKKLTSEERNNLPDSDFAYIKPGGKKVDGKTEPRSLRMLPIHDAEHVRSALSYLDRTDIPEKARKEALVKIKKAAKKFGVEVSEAETDKERKEKLDREEDDQDKEDFKKENKKEKEAHEKDAIKEDKKEIKDLKKDEKIDKKTEEKLAKGSYNDKGQYVPYEGPEPKEQVQYVEKAMDEDGKYVPYQGPEPKEQIQYIEIPAEEKLQHQSYMSECMMNDDMHVNTKGLDENRSRMACAIAYDRKYKTSYAPCGPFGCKY